MGKAEEMLIAHQEKREKRELTEGPLGAYSPGRLTSRPLLAGVQRVPIVREHDVHVRVSKGCVQQRVSRQRRDARHVGVALVCPPDGVHQGAGCMVECVCGATSVDVTDADTNGGPFSGDVDFVPVDTVPFFYDHVEHGHEAPKLLANGTREPSLEGVSF